jgi:hypothetical protein
MMLTAAIDDLLRLRGVRQKRVVPIHCARPNFSTTYAANGEKQRSFWSAATVIRR